MSVIALANTKGGSSKTTCATVLAARYASEGVKVALLDADPDGRAGVWFRAFAVATGYEGNLSVHPKLRVLLETHTHKGITYIPSVDDETIIDLIEQYSDSHDVVIVDLQGSANQTMVFACGRADLVLIPVQASAYDLVAMERTVRVVRQALRSTERNPEQWVILTNTSSGAIQTKVDKHARDEVEALEAGGHIKVLNVELGNRTAFRRMTFTGLPPQPDTDKSASENVEAFANEVALILQGKHPKQQPAAQAAATA